MLLFLQLFCRGHYIIVAAVKLTTINVYCNNLCHCVSVSVSVCVQSALNKSRKIKKKKTHRTRNIFECCVVCRLCLDYENISQLQSQQQQKQKHCNILHAIAWRKGLSYTYKYDSLGYLLVSYWIWINFVCFFSMDCNHFISYEMLCKLRVEISFPVGKGLKIWVGCVDRNINIYL